MNGLNNNVTELQKLGGKYEQIDRNSLLLLVLLTLPAGVMVVVLFLWPDVLWIAEIPYTAVGVLGSFVAMLLSVSIITRYRGQSGIPYISAGLMAIGIIDGFRAFSTPGSTEFVWLHSLAGIAGGIFFAFYVLTEMTRLPMPSIQTTTKGVGWLLGGTAMAALLLGALTIVFSGILPPTMQENHLTPVAWIMSSIPVALYLFAGSNLLWQYRKTGSHELFLFTAILIFLFQASEIFYFATFWGVIWWLWQALRLTVYLAVLGYVLKEYIQISDSLAMEISERNKVEKALRKAEEDWRNSFNSLEEAMLIMDKDYNIEKINNSGLALLRKDGKEVIGGKCYQVIYGENKPCQYCPLKQTLRSKKPEPVERYDELFQKHFSIKITPIYDEHGEVIKFIYLTSDITERINAEAKERLLQQELNLNSRLASIGEVAAGITHEINNPLTSIIAFAQMMTKMDVPENMREAVEVVNDGAKRVAGIVEKLLTFARRNKPEKEYVDVNSIVANTLEMRLYEMRTKNIEVTSQFASDLPRTMANVGQLQQVFLNIIINAEQAMAEVHGRGKLFVKTERIDNSIRVSIADDGPGIAKGNIDKIFDPFFTTKGSVGGTGLGLSVSYGIIKEHGGKIYAESTSCKGATLFVELPIIAETTRLEMAEPSSKETEKITRAKILVVDDEPHICRALDRLLTQEGHKVETVSNAQTALRRLNISEYDLILLDIRMPGMNGIEFYNRMKEMNSSLQQRVVCITGDVISTENKAFLDKAGIPCLAKPFSADELMGQVKSVLGGQNNDAQTTYSRC